MSLVDVASVVVLHPSGGQEEAGLVTSYFLCQDMQYLDYNIGSGISQMVDALTNYTSSIRFFNDLFEIV